MDIARCLNEIEARVGRLSPMQKFLLGTDGSVTQILEAITGKQVIIETREQKIIPADPTTADRLGSRRATRSITVSSRSKPLPAAKCSSMRYRILPSGGFPRNSKTT